MSDRLRIRPAVSDDHAALEAIYVRASLANERDRALLLSNPDILAFSLDRIERRGVFVAERDGTIAGFISIIASRPPSAEIDGLFVDPHRWRNGTGKRLLEAALQWASALQFTELTVISSDDALAFYAACGFKEAGSATTRFGPALRLIRHLQKD